MIYYRWRRRQRCRAWRRARCGARGKRKRHRRRSRRRHRLCPLSPGRRRRPARRRALNVYRARWRSAARAAAAPRILCIRCRLGSACIRGCVGHRRCRKAAVAAASGRGALAEMVVQESGERAYVRASQQLLLTTFVAMARGICSLGEW